MPPLGGVLKDGKLYGRGVCDMKGGIACSLLAATLLAEHRDAWVGEIVLTLAGDEENMGSLGTGYMLEHVPHATGDANICGDVGSPRVVRFGEKGLMWVEVEATGSPAHGAHVHGHQRHRPPAHRARPAEGAGGRALPGAAGRHRRRSPRPSRSPNRCRAPAKPRRCRASRSTSAPSRAAPRPISCRPTAIARADIRLPVGITTDVLAAKLDEWLAPLEGVSWRRSAASSPPSPTPDHEIVDAHRRRSPPRCWASAPAVNMRVGGSDSRWYRMYDVPTVVLGLTPFNMGGADEYVLVDELLAVAKIHTLAAFDFLSAEH